MRESQKIWYQANKERLQEYRRAWIRRKREGLGIANPKMYRDKLTTELPPPKPISKYFQFKVRIFEKAKEYKDYLREWRAKRVPRDDEAVRKRLQAEIEAKRAKEV